MEPSHGKGFVQYIKTPLQKHEDEITKRGFTPEQAGQFTRLLSATEIQCLLEMNVIDSMSATAYPYYDVFGRPMTFRNEFGEQHYSSVRFHAPYDKSHKYLSPKIPGKVYYPQVTDWRDLPDNTEINLVEGEVKSLKGMLHDLEGLHWCVGFAGHTRVVPGGHFPKEMSQISLKDRRVNIIMDYDVKEVVEGDYNTLPADAPYIGTKVVEDSIKKICVALHLAGARPFIVKLGETALGQTVQNGEKLGLDDFLDAGGTWKELRQFTYAVPEEYIWTAQLLEDWIYVQSANGYIKAGYNNNIPITAEHLKEETRDMHWPGKSRPVYAVDKFRDHKDRRKVSGLELDPRITMDITPQGTFSTFRGWKYDAMDVGQDKVKEYIRMVEGLYGPHVDIIWKWLADIRQNPWRRPQWAPILSGPQGVGKSIMFGHVVAMLGNHARAGVNYKDLFESGNRIFSDNILCVCDELVVEGGNKKARDALKNIITDNEMSIKFLYMNEFPSPVRTRLAFTTNHVDSIPIDPDDRRWLVRIVRGMPSDQKDLALRVYHHRFDEDFLRGLAFHLDSIDLSGFNPGQAPLMTDDMKEFALESRTDFDVWADEFLKHIKDEGKDLWLHDKMVTLYARAQGWDVKSATRLKQRMRERAVYHGLIGESVERLFFEGRQLGGLYLGTQPFTEYKGNTDVLWRRGCELTGYSVMPKGV